MADAYELPPHVKPRFDPANPPADIASNPACWDYWAVDSTGDRTVDLCLGIIAAHECLTDEDRETTRPMLAYALATMRDKGKWSDVEAGFVNLLGRNARCGAKPLDIVDATPPELTELQRTHFRLGMSDAIADMELGADAPARIMARIAHAVILQEYTAEFAGYATAIIGSATACGEH